MSRLRSSSLWFTILAMVLLVAGVVLSVVFWDWLRPEAPALESRSTTVRNIGLLIGAVIALVFAIWRSIIADRQATAAQRQADTARQDLLQDRFQRGAEMIGSKDLVVRLGGIYALERLAVEHPEQYHIEIMRLFCAFVRHPTKDDSDEATPDTQGATPTTPRRREDVQTAMTTIGSRSRAGVDLEESTGSFRLALHGAYLRGVHLPGANLSGTNLGGANMVGAYLYGADLSNTHLQDANLQHAIFIEANLSGATLSGTEMSHVVAQNTNLSGTRLGSTNLSHAHLQGANLSGAHLNAADLSHARLEDANLSGAIIGTATRVTLSDPPQSEIVSTHVTQAQLNEAKADPDNPPKIDEVVVDAHTGEPLVWNGKPLDDEA